MPARLLDSDFSPPVRLPRTIAQWTPLTAECQCPHRSRISPGIAIDASADRPPWPLAVCVSAEEEMQLMKEVPEVRADTLDVLAAIRGAEPDTTPPGCH